MKSPSDISGSGQEGTAVIRGATSNGSHDAAVRGAQPIPQAVMAAASTTETVWSAVCAGLRIELGADLFASWIASARLYETGAAVILAAHTETARDWIKRNAWRRVVELWAAHDRSHRPLVLRSRAETANLAAEGPVTPMNPTTSMVAESDMKSAPPQSAPQSHIRDEAGRPFGLQDRFTFENFVAHSSNDFALTVAKKVGAWSDGCFNNVLLHGPS